MSDLGPRPFRVKRSTSNWLPVRKVLGLHWLTRVLRRRHAATPIYQRSRRGSLLLEGSEIAGRPKTFAVLRYLVENTGRLVSKEELFAAVWPSLAVTDD